MPRTETTKRDVSRSRLDFRIRRQDFPHGRDPQPLRNIPQCPHSEMPSTRFRDELLNGEIFYSLREAQILIERWRHHYNTVRPHSALGYRPPAPESIITVDQNPTMH